MAEIGAIGGPELSAAFGLATVAAHGPALYSNTDSLMNAGYEVWAKCFDQSAKLANAALDAHSQSGPLAFDKTCKPPMGIWCAGWQTTTRRTCRSSRLRASFQIKRSYPVFLEASILRRRA
jgi:hypothetical protein